MSGQAGEIDEELGAILYGILDESQDGGHVQGDPKNGLSIVDGYFDLKKVAAAFVASAQRSSLK